MTMRVEQAAVAKGTFEVRSGKCPVCGITFDDDARAPYGDKRWCPRCQEYRLGKLKVSGILKDRKR